jgi:sulfatase modifying factor 1
MRILCILAAVFFLAAAAAPTIPRLPFTPSDASALQKASAELAGAKTHLINSIGMKLVIIPPGRFEMGPNGSRHRVTLAKPFYLGVHEVTLGEYRKFKSGHQIEGAADEFNHDDRPVAMINWHEARAFCNWLSELPTEKAAGRTYALPTEAQWEWAARAGTTTARHFGETDKSQSEYCWFNSTYIANPKTENKGRGRQPVGTLKPNAFGLYDMLGNVWEWCDDRRGDEVTGETRDPVMRGGSWRSGAFHCTSVAHDPADVNVRGDHIGFRAAYRVLVK